MDRSKKGRRKKGGRRGRGGKGPKITFCLAPNEMTRKQLLPLIKRMIDEMGVEKDERNFFLLESERLFSFWNILIERLAIEKERSSALESHLAQKEREGGQIEDESRGRLRALQANETWKLGAIRLLHLKKMRIVQDEIWTLYGMMREDNTRRKHLVSQTVLGLYETLRNLKMEHNSEVVRVQRALQGEVRFAEIEEDQIFTEEVEGRERSLRDRIGSLRKRKEDQISQMFRIHDRLYINAKTFFNDITGNNMEYLSGLEAEVLRLKERETRLRRELKRALEDRKELQAPLQVMEDQMEGWEKAFELEEYQKIVRRKLVEVQGKKETVVKYERSLALANETLRQRIEIAKGQKDALKGGILHGSLEQSRRRHLQEIIHKLRGAGDCHS